MPPRRCRVFLFPCGLRLGDLSGTPLDGPGQCAIALLLAVCRPAPLERRLRRAVRIAGACFTFGSTLRSDSVQPCQNALVHPTATFWTLPDRSEVRCRKDRGPNVKGGAARRRLLPVQTVTDALALRSDLTVADLWARPPQRRDGSTLAHNLPEYASALS